ncbi:MAG: hypothetical protein ACRCZO_11905, partial [Cetobacterium sp.]
MGHINQTVKKSIQRMLNELKIFEALIDPKVTEVMINSNKKIFLKKLGEGYVCLDFESKDEILINLLKLLSGLDNKV